MHKAHVGIVGTGVYIPKYRMTAEEVARATKGLWTEDAVRSKLGIVEKPIPGPGDGTQEMGVKAGLDALERTGTDPLDIDLILCMGEEWKEYPLTTSGIYIQEKIGAVNAWAIDMQQRCCSTVAAMKIARDMMLSDSKINTAMIVGGYRNGDFVDYTDPDMSMMYNLSAGGGAIILKKNLGRNELLETRIMSDGSMARDAGVEIGGTMQPITVENVGSAYRSLKLMDSDHMKTRLNEVSMSNWMQCIDEAFQLSEVPKSELDYLAVLHFKRSMHDHMLDLLGLGASNSIYLENYGHMGQVDQILSLQLGLESGKIQDGSVVSMIAAGIGYAWAANVIRWGPVAQGGVDDVSQVV